jgi:hypothetical protein
MTQTPSFIGLTKDRVRKAINLNLIKISLKQVMVVDCHILSLIPRFWNNLHNLTGQLKKSLKCEKFQMFEVYRETIRLPFFRRNVSSPEEEFRVPSIKNKNKKLSKHLIIEMK